MEDDRHYFDIGRSACIRNREPNIGSVVSYQRPAVGPASTEDSEMFARKGLFSSIGRTTALATVAALALTAVEPSLAVAGPVKEKGLTAATGTSDATDFSARRYYRGGYYRGGGGGAPAAALCRLGRARSS